MCGSDRFRDQIGRGNCSVCSCFSARAGAAQTYDWSNGTRMASGDGHFFILFLFTRKVNSIDCIVFSLLLSNFKVYVIFYSTSEAQKNLQ